MYSLFSCSVFISKFLASIILRLSTANPCDFKVKHGLIGFGFQKLNSVLRGSEHDGVLVSRLINQELFAIQNRNLCRGIINLCAEECWKQSRISNANINGSSG